MRVTLIGVGGAADTLTWEAREALERAELVLGAQRLLDALPPRAGQRRAAAVRAEEIAGILRRGAAAESCVVYSGDTGFYSGARDLTPLLDAAGTDYRVLPGVSSVQMLASRLRRPWQDWTLRSAHGVGCDAVAAVMTGRPAFFLTGGENTPSTLCGALTDAGLGALAVTVGENLSRPDARVVETTASEAADMTFAPLSVLLVESAPRPFARSGAIPDEAFCRGEVPMTKQMVRAAILASLGVMPEETVWDVGAGTGSVSVELALAARQGRVFAVERRADACALVRRNRERFGAWNLTVVEGEAPAALEALPAPDAVFVGGSGGNLRAILAAAAARNPNVRLCLSAIALETLSAAISALKEMDLETEITQISVSRTRTAGELHLLTANNPVFLLTAKRGGAV